MTKILSKLVPNYQLSINICLSHYNCFTSLAWPCFLGALDNGLARFLTIIIYIIGISIVTRVGRHQHFQILFSIYQNLRKTLTKNKIKNRKYPFSEERGLNLRKKADFVDVINLKRICLS